MAGNTNRVASSNKMRLSLALEDVQGRRNAPYFGSPIDQVNHNLQGNASFSSSNTVRADRMSPGSVRTEVSAGGSVNAEVGWGHHDPLYLMGLGARFFRIAREHPDYATAFAATANLQLTFTPAFDGTNQVTIVTAAGANFDTLVGAAGTLFFIDDIPADEQASWFNGLWQVVSTAANSVVAIPLDIPQGWHNVTGGAASVTTTSLTVVAGTYTRDNSLPDFAIAPAAAGTDLKLVTLTGANGDDWGDFFRVGHYFRIRGIVEATGGVNSEIYNTLYRVVSITEAVGPNDVVVAAPMVPAIRDIGDGSLTDYPTSNVLDATDGVRIQFGFFADNDVCQDFVTIEDRFTDVVTSEGTHDFFGGLSDGFTVTLSTGNFVTVEFPFTGLNRDWSALNAPDTYSATPTGSKFSPISGVAGILANSVCRCYESFNLQISNNNSTESCIGRETAVQNSQNTISITGGGSAKFEGEADSLRRFYDDTLIPQSVFFQDDASNVLGFDLPATRTSEGSLPNAGQNNAAVEAWSFVGEIGSLGATAAAYDGGTAVDLVDTMIRLWKFPAIA